MGIRIRDFGQTFLRIIPLLGCFIAIFFCFRALSGTSAALFFLSFFFLYMLTTIACHHGITMLEAYERAFALTTKKRLGFSILTCFPTYLMWLLTSVLPIKTWVAWVLVGFPLIVLSTFPIFAICDEYWRRSPKLLLWSCHFGVYFICFSIGQTIGNIVV